MRIGTRRRRRPDRIRVAVIGGGFGGIAAAIELKKVGIDDIVVVEKSSGLGGTWFDNRYPGAQTDAASHMYCYSFARYDWSRTHVGHRELREYLEHVVDRFDVRKYFRFGSAVQSVVWDESAQQYSLTIEHHSNGSGTARTGGPEMFHAVISAVGMFGAPRLPDLAGLDTFAGRTVHTAAWDDSIALDGKRVAVMGTGSSATQVVASIAARAQRVVVYQRQPGWLLPKGDRAFTPLERRIYRLPLLWRVNRLRLYLRQERREFRGSVFLPGSAMNLRSARAALDLIADVFADRPDLRAMVTPGYSFGGKRAVLSSAYYQALLRDNVELVPRAVVSCTPTGVVDAAGEEREVDVLVMATGFRPADYLAGLRVVGCNGVDLHEQWHGEPSAFLGITVPNFPNFFLLYGPNTNGGFIIPNLERQSAYAAKEIGRLGRRGVTAVEVRAGVTERYNRWLQRKLARTAFTATDNYYVSASGKVVTQWPESATLYAVLTVLLRRISSHSRKGPATGAPVTSATATGASVTGAADTAAPTPVQDHLDDPARFARPAGRAGHAGR